MWRRWLRDVGIEWHWIKRDMIRRWSLDTPVGIMGILIIISGVLFIIIVGDAVAHVFRSFIPWLSGSSVSEIYWKSLAFGLKVSSVFLLFSGSLIIYFLLKYSNRR
jgi:hypothetical protein